nr:nucleotidyltransferase family protein [Pseudomonadota bacterium]
MSGGDALDFIGGCLNPTAGPESADALRAAIVAGRPDWMAVVATANRHLLAPALWAALRDKDLTAHLPQDLHDYLHALYQLNGQRNVHLRQQLEETVRQLNAAGIAPVLLKGAMALLTGAFDPAARMMLDLDILVPRRDLQAALDALHALGYRADGQPQIDYARHHHCPPLFRAGDYGSLEVHQDLLLPTAAPILPTAAAWAQAEDLAVAGIRARVLSPTHQALYNVLHAQIADLHHAAGTIDLRSLHNLALIQAAWGEAIDWQAIRAAMDRHGKGGVLRAYLYLAWRLLGMAPPDGLRPDWRSRCHYARCRAQRRWAWAGGWIARLARSRQRFAAYYIHRRYGHTHS